MSRGNWEQLGLHRPAAGPASGIRAGLSTIPESHETPSEAVSGWSLLPAASWQDAEQLRSPSWAVPMPAEPCRTNFGVGGAEAWRQRGGLNGGKGGM